VGLSLTGLLPLFVACCTAWPDPWHAQLPAQSTAGLLSRLEAPADDMWRFVQKQAHKQWLWIVIAATTRQSIACHGGSAESRVARSSGPLGR
jgi:hypothetical protein